VRVWPVPGADWRVPVQPRARAAGRDRVRPGHPGQLSAGRLGNALGRWRAYARCRVVSGRPAAVHRNAGRKRPDHRHHGRQVFPVRRRGLCGRGLPAVLRHLVPEAAALMATDPGAIDPGAIDPGAIDPAEFRRAAGRLPTGILVVGTRLDGVDHAMTVSAFSAVSLEPVLVLFCAEKIARFHDTVLEAGFWSVSVLDETAEKTARWLATRGRPLEGQL